MKATAVCAGGFLCFWAGGLCCIGCFVALGFFFPSSHEGFLTYAGNTEFRPEMKVKKSKRVLAFLKLKFGSQNRILTEPNLLECLDLWVWICLWTVNDTKHICNNISLLSPPLCVGPNICDKKKVYQEDWVLSFFTNLSLLKNLIWPTFERAFQYFRM